MIHRVLPIVRRQLPFCMNAVCQNATWSFNIQTLLFAHTRGSLKSVFTLLYQENHPSPGEAFQGGVFEAFLPDSERTRTLLPRLEEAFRQGLIFTVIGVDTGARASWDGIPHKTTLHGGKSGWVSPAWTSNQAVKSEVPLVHVSEMSRLLFVSHRNGYPDSTYLTRLSDVLTANGIGEAAAKS